MADAALPSAALASARAALAGVPSLRLALALFALFFLLELLQRWAVLRPVRRHVISTSAARALTRPAPHARRRSGLRRRCASSGATRASCGGARRS